VAGRVRLGVVLQVDPPAATEIDGLRRALGDGGLGRVAPHVTLVTPVNVPAASLGDALAVLRSAATATAAPLRLELGPATTFHPVTPVVFLAVGGDLGGLESLRERVLRPPLARTTTHPFVPHVTVADDMAPERIPAAVAALADFRTEVTVDRLHLLRETPGRVWRPIADVPFGAPAVVARGGLPLELMTSRLVDPVAGALLGGDDPGPGELGDDTGRWAVTARRNGEPVGVASGVVVGDRLDVEVLVVAPEHRGQGIGRHLRAAVDHLAGVRSVAWPPIRPSSNG
jgi:2'-5' RNA ligase